MEQDKRTLTKEEYFSVKEAAVRDLAEILNNEHTKLELNSRNKKQDYASRKAQDRYKSLNSESSLIYVANFLISNNERFKEAYIDLKKNIREIANHFDVDYMYAIMKLSEINKYERLYGDIPVQDEIAATNQPAVTNAPKPIIKDNELMYSLIQENELLNTKVTMLERKNILLTEQLEELRDRLATIQELSNIPNMYDNVDIASKQK